MSRSWFLVLGVGLLAVVAVLVLRGPTVPDIHVAKRPEQGLSDRVQTPGEGPTRTGPPTGMVSQAEPRHGPAAGPGAGPDALADNAPPPPPLPTPSPSEVAHRQALADPRNPERWVEYAKALDAEGKSDLAIAALRRALHLGVDFEGRREVLRLVREYEEYLRRRDQEPRGDRRSAPSEAIPGPPIRTRSR